MKNDTRLMEWSGMETPGREPRKGMRRACQGRKEARPRRRHPTVLSQEWITRHCSPIPRSRAHRRCKVLPFSLSMILPLCEISDGTFHMDLEGRKTSNPFVLSSPFRSFKDMDHVKPKERGPKAERHIGVSRLLQGSRSNGTTPPIEKKGTS